MKRLATSRVVDIGPPTNGGRPANGVDRDRRASTGRPGLHRRARAGAPSSGGSAPIASRVRRCLGRAQPRACCSRRRRRVSGWRTPWRGRHEARELELEAGPGGGRGGSELRADVHEPQPRVKTNHRGAQTLAVAWRHRFAFAWASLPAGKHSGTTTGSRFRSAEAPQCHGPSYSPSSCS